MKKLQKIKAWALMENGKLSHYYKLAFITFTKKQAKIEQSYYNSEPLNHKMKIIPCIVTYPKK